MGESSFCSCGSEGSNCGLGTACNAPPHGSLSGQFQQAVYPFKASRKFSLQSAKTASYVRDSPFAMSEKRLWQIDCIQSPSTSQTFWDAEKILTRWTWTSSKTLACCLIVNSAISHSTDWPNFPIRPALITLGPHSSVFLESTRHTTASGSSSGCSTPPTTQTQGSLGVTQYCVCHQATFTCSIDYRMTLRPEHNLLKPPLPWIAVCSDFCTNRLCSSSINLSIRLNNRLPGSSTYKTLWDNEGFRKHELENAQSHH